ncbi:MAG: translocation/assembly module TamB, partial [Bacteroides sp.]|nr:translocation/assembly module TamB [Bacteroides sp.]
MYGNLNTSIGSARTDIKLGYDQQKNIFHYSGALQSQEFELGKLTGRPDILNKISLNIEVDGEHTATRRYPSIKAIGYISAVDYKDYTYENIELDGEFKEGGFDGTVAINDENGSLYLSGNFNVAVASPRFNIKAEMNRFNPHALHLTENYEGSDISFILDADFTGNSIDDMIGNITVDSITLVTPGDLFFTERIQLEASQQEQKKILTLTSEYLHLLIKGDYSYQTLPVSIINILNSYLPSLVSRKGESESKNNFYFDLSLFNTQPLTRIFKLPFTVQTHSTIKGFVHDHSGKLRIEGYFPKFSLGNSTFESGVVICENPKDHLSTHIRAGGRMKNGAALNIALRNQAKADQLTTILSWGNNGVTTYSGELTAISDFLKNPGKDPPLSAYIQIEPTIAILNDSIWNIEPSYVRIDSGKVTVNKFRVSHKDQHLTIHGIASAEVSDTVKVELNDIEIGFIFDIVNIQAVDFDGIATGEVTANRLLKTPIMNTELEIKNLHFNNGLLGDMFVDGRWDQVNEGIDLHACIYEDSIAKTEVTGLISIGQKALDLHIDAEGTNIEFLQKYMEVIASDVAGRAYGTARLHGSFKDLNLEGSLLADASFRIDLLNTRFGVRDTVWLLPDQVAFRNVTIYDPEGNKGIVDGALYHQHFRDLTYSIQANVDNMLVMNTQEDPDLPFYGTAYVTGTAFIRGGGNELNVDVAVTSNRNTQMVYTTGNAATAASNEFIRFVDKTPRRTLPDTSAELFPDHTLTGETGEEMDIRLNILVDATPDATIRIIMDPVAGDYISGRGSGSLHLDFYNKGDVRIFGNYVINQGVYKFSLQEVIRKDFVIRNGSTIVFNGDPLNANLDVTAAYTVNSVSLSDLSEDITSMTGGQNRAKVDCVMNITGILVQPTINLSIELPTENDAVQRAVQSYINTEEERNMQILYLLGIGKFYTLNYATQNSNAMSSVLSSTLSGQLNNALSQIIDNSNWNIGTNLSTGSEGWTEMEVEGMLSGQLLNNRLLINGNFGYRETLSSTTNFVGDFDVEYLLTPSGNIRLKGYNKTNDRFYTQKTLTTQGLGVGYKREFNRWREFRIWNRKHGSVQPVEEISTEKDEE